MKQCTTHAAVKPGVGIDVGHALFPVVAGNIIHLRRPVVFIAGNNIKTLLTYPVCRRKSVPGKCFGWGYKVTGSGKKNKELLNINPRIEFFIKGLVKPVCG